MINTSNTYINWRIDCVGWCIVCSCQIFPVAGGISNCTNQGQNWGKTNVQFQTQTEKWVI